MNKRKLISALCAAALISAIGIGATLAYFTDSDEVVNTVAIGHVDIKMTENKVIQDEDGSWTATDEVAVAPEGLSFTEVMPGAILPKNPTVSLNMPSEPAYIRVKMSVEPGGGNTSDISEELALLTANLKAEILKEPNWYYNESDDYFYYTPVLEKEEDRAVLFTNVSIPGSEWGNATAGQTFHIKLQAQALQAAHTSQGNADDVVVKTNGTVTSWTLAPEDIETYPYITP